MEYERIKAENETKKLVQEAQEKVTFPLPLQPSCKVIFTLSGKRETCQYQSYETVKNFKWRKQPQSSKSLPVIVDNCFLSSAYWAFKLQPH